MADVVLTRGGLKSQAPGAGSQISKAIEQSRRNRGGGGGGGSSSLRNANEAKRIAEEAARRVAEQEAKRLAEEKAAIEKQIAEAKTFAEKQRLASAYVERQKAQRELRRIEQERRRLAALGAKTTQQQSRDVKSGDKLRVTQTFDRKGNRVEMITNLRTGETNYSSFARPKKGGLVRRTGGVSVSSSSGTNKDVVQEILDAVRKARGTPVRKIIKVNGQEISIKNTGRVVVGKELAGAKLEFQDGILRKINGEDLYEEKLGSVKTEKLGKIISTKRLTELASNYSKRSSDIEKNLEGSLKKGDLERFKELTNKGSKITSSERRERDKLRAKIANRNREVISMVGLTMAAATINLGLGTAELSKSLVRDPIGTIKRLPKDTWEGLKQDYKRARGSQLGALNVAAEWAVMAGAFKLGGKGVSKGLGVVRRTIGRLNPKYVRLIENKYTIRKAPKETFTRRGKEVRLKSRVQRPSIKRPFSSVSDFLNKRKPGQFKKFTKDPGLALKLQTVSSGSKTLSQQARLAGKEVTAVNAAADQLTSWIRRKKIIRKPFNLSGKHLEKRFPLGEKSFPPRIQKLLKKFDSGTKLTTKEFAEVNLWLQKNIASNVTLLERSLYLDPESGLRISRLGIGSERTIRPTLKDILRGNFRLWEKAQKPQVLIFENAQVARFPKSLSTIKNKLLAGKKLTVAETNKLIQWQVKTGSGKFKPIGSTIYQGGIEFEVTLAPGELIKRIKEVGFTYIDWEIKNGVRVKIKPKKVTFVTAEVYRPPKNIVSKMKMASEGKLSTKALSNLEKDLSKQLGRKIQVETPTTRARARGVSNKPVLRIRGKGLVVSRIGRSVSRVRGSVERRITRTPRRRITRTTRTRVRDRTRARPKRTQRPKPRRTLRRTTRTTRTRPGRNKRTTSRNRTRRNGGRRMGGRTTTTKPPKPPIRLPKGYKERTLSKPQPTFLVVTKKRGKIVKLYPKPLILTDAKDLLAYSVDNNLTKTAWFRPLGSTKKVIKPPKIIQGYFEKVRGKLRPYRIREGKKRLLRNGFIEKRRFGFDTLGERRQLSTLQKGRVRTRTKKKVVKRVMPKTRVRKRVFKKRKITLAQRKVLLANLKKARAARKRR